MSRKMKVRCKELPYTRAWTEQQREPWIAEPNHKTKDEKRYDRYVTEIDKLREEVTLLTNKIFFYEQQMRQLISQAQTGYLSGMGPNTPMCSAFIYQLGNLVGQGTVHVTPSCSIYLDREMLRSTVYAQATQIAELQAVLERAVVFPNPKDDNVQRRVKIRGNHEILRSS
jgi:hypothetical protein